MDPNDGLRFALELVGLVAYSMWGYSAADGLLAVALALALPLSVATVWAVFRVPNDPGPSPVTIPGPLRLSFEVVVFALAVAALIDVGMVLVGGALAGAVLVHYALARKRVARLVARGR